MQSAYIQAPCLFYVTVNYSIIYILTNILTRRKSMNTLNIGQNIRKHRKKTGLTIAKFAEKAGISDVYMSEIERNVKTPSLKTYIKIIRALEISFDTCLCNVSDSGKAHIFNDITEMMVNLSPKEICYIRDQIKLAIDFFKQTL